MVQPAYATRLCASLGTLRMTRIGTSEKEKKKKKPGAKRCKAKYLSEFCAKKKNAPLRKNFVYT